MRDYDWQCQVCNGVNPAVAAACAQCGCPAEVNRLEIEFRKRAHEGVEVISAGQAKKLPIDRIVKEAFLLVWRQQRRFFQALLGTGLLIAILSTVLSYLSTLWLSAAAALARGIVFALFAVTCHRIALLGEESVPKYGIWSWSRRETRFIGWMFFGYACIVFVSIIIGLPAAGAVGPHGSFLAGSTAGTYVMARFAILLPATAIDERQDLGWAWRISSNNGWRLVAIVVLMPWLLAKGIQSAAFEISHHPMIIFAVSLLSCALAAFEIVALSLSFRYLTQERQSNNAVPRTL